MEENTPTREPPVKSLLSHLGWEEEVPTLGMFTPSDDEDWFPGNLTPEVYQALVGGPRLQCLDGQGFGLGWALRGRVFHPKGVLPTALFNSSQPRGSNSPLFHKELFFCLRQVGEITESSFAYQIKFTPEPLWPEDWQQHHPEQPKPKKSSKLPFQTQNLPTGPYAKHARDLGLSLDELDRMDRPSPVRGRARPDITVWRTPQFSPPDNSMLCTGSSSPMEVDCVEILFSKIFEKAMTIPVHKPSAACGGGDTCVKTAEKQSPLTKFAEVEKHSPLPAPVEEEPEVPEISVAILPKKRSLEKKLRSFMRRLFSCASLPSQHH